MADLLPFLALLALAAGWFFLPLLPALRELLRPTDIAALKVVDRSSGYVAYFARNFRMYLEKQTALLPAEQQVGDFFGRLPDGTRLIRIHKAGDTLERESQEGAENRLVVVDVPLALEGGETFLMELYARAPLTGGPGAVYRAVYAEKELTLGDDSTVLRWAHAGGRLTVGKDSVLRGRISSDLGVELAPGVVFERIGAPIISAGNHSPPEPPPPPPAPPAPWQFPAGAKMVGDHVRIAGDAEIPPGLRVAASLVVAGRLSIGLGTIVEGSVKAHGDVVLADEAQVQGAVVTRTRLVVGRGAWIGGPAIAEVSIRLGRGALVGGPELPATASAPEVELETGAAVYGQISAPNGARTL
ncbi:MAG TPA: polymer-forming cytoskeletal protein [Gemmatimonadales bacterium]|nr:polymer-forming cytoskeletal protein [Gemmatimonadales bacterium]